MSIEEKVWEAILGSKKTNGLEVPESLRQRYSDCQDGKRKLQTRDQATICSLAR